MKEENKMELESIVKTLRGKEKKGFLYNGSIYWKQKNAEHIATIQGKAVKLHREIYKNETGKDLSDKRFNVIFIDGNFQNLDLSNLLCCTQNQYYKLKASGIVKTPLAAYLRDYSSLPEEEVKDVYTDEKVYREGWVKKPLITDEDRLNTELEKAMENK